MSDRIDRIEKRIYNNQPSHLPSVTIPYAQYNYGRATKNDPYRIMGNMSNQYYENLELYISWFSRLLFKNSKCLSRFDLKSSSQKLKIFWDKSFNFILKKFFNI